MEELLQRLGLLVQARYPLLYLLTHEEERTLRGLGKLAETEGLALYEWRVSTGVSRAGQPIAPGTDELELALDTLADIDEPALFVLLDAHSELDRPSVLRRIRDMEADLGKRKQALVVVSAVLTVPAELEKEITVEQVPLPGRDEIGRLLRVLCKKKRLKLDPDLEEKYVQTALGMTEKEVKRAFAQVLLAGGQFDGTDLGVLVDAKCAAIRRTQYMEYLHDVNQMADVGGLENLKEWLRRRGLAFKQEARDFGLPEPKGVFLLGVQGCGKSLTAKACAGLFRIPLLRLDVGAVFQGAGGAEASLRDTIRVAESIAPVVLWIDELEKGFLSTSEIGGGRAFGTFLTWLQEKSKPVFVVATANEVRVLPPELLRKGRFDEIFFVDLPDVHERLEILDIHVKRRGRDPEDFDLLQCAEMTEKYSGAELEQVIVEALFNAYAEGRALSHRDLIRTIRDTVPLAVTMDDRLKELREWARPRTRPASVNRRRIDFFEDFQT